MSAKETTTPAQTRTGETGETRKLDTHDDDKPHDDGDEERQLAQKLANLDVVDEAELADPTLHSGELIVRQAGKTHDGECDVQKVMSFQALNIGDELKRAVSQLGWQTMSKIQQIGLPLLLSEPPHHLIGQAQAGSGKTATFVLGCLSRVDGLQRPSQPQAIILAGTQELVTQIAEVVMVLGKEKGIRPRRIMSAGDYSSQGFPGSFGRGGGGGGGRGGARGGGGGVGSGAPPAARAATAEWSLSPGQDFAEQVVVGTPGKVKQYLRDFLRGRKPHIDASHVKCLVLDEADVMVQEPPHGFGGDVFEIRDLVFEARKGPSNVQLMLFSATFTPEVRQIARRFVGNDPRLYHEITLSKEDLTLDKIDNFFVLVGREGDSVAEINAAKDRAIIQIWESLADSPLLGQTVIFVNTRQRCQALAAFLRENNYEVGQINGEIDKMEREKVFQEFKEGKRPALVATNILSRGIDNQNVTLVINVDLPEKLGTRAPDPETFVHRIGRSGRWTKRGASVSLVSPDPKVTDKAYMAAIERQLFANESVDRPLIQVADPSLFGEALKRRMEERAALIHAATAQGGGVTEGKQSQ